MRIYVTIFHVFAAEVRIGNNTKDFIANFAVRIWKLITVKKYNIQNLFQIEYI